MEITGMRLNANFEKPEDSEIQIDITDNDDYELLISGDGDITLVDDYEDIVAHGHISTLIRSLRKVR